MLLCPQMQLLSGDHWPHQQERRPLRSDACATELAETRGTRASGQGPGLGLRPGFRVLAPRDDRHGRRGRPRWSAAASRPPPSSAAKTAQAAGPPPTTALRSAPRRAPAPMRPCPLRRRCPGADFESRTSPPCPRSAGAGGPLARRIGVRDRVGVGEPPGRVRRPRGHPGVPAPSGSPASSSPATTRSASCASPSYSTSAADGTPSAQPLLRLQQHVERQRVQRLADPVRLLLQHLQSHRHDGNNDTHDGWDETYPNPSRDFSAPTISSAQLGYEHVRRTTARGTGIYEDADTPSRLNGLATSGFDRAARPGPRTNGQDAFESPYRGRLVNDGGPSGGVWKSGSYIAIVAKSNFTGGNHETCWRSSSTSSWEGWIPV